MIEKSAKLFGYWPVINNSDSASSAAKMSGLPVLFSGLSTIATVAYQISPTKIAADFLMWGSLGLGLLLLIVAFRIRAGHHAWLPFVLFPMLLVVLANTYETIGGNNLDVSKLSWLSHVIAILMVILTLRGLRGWFWKRRNKVGMSF
jgi:lysylphosphatidylglycerol synthetase-like protein (DUF2156 family)